MNHDSKINWVTGIGIVALGAAVYTAYKICRVADKLDMSVNEVSKSSHLDISDRVVESAVRTAATKEGTAMAIDIANELKKQIHEDIRRQVEKSVSDAYDDIKNDVETEIKRRIGKINIEYARQEVINKAKERAAEKFESDLDGILEKYNGELASVSKIYSSIAQSMTGCSTGKITLGLN